MCILGASSPYLIWQGSDDRAYTHSKREWSASPNPQPSFILNTAILRCYVVNLQAWNAILLHSYYMVPLKKSTFLSTVVDKGRRVFSNRSTQHLPGDLHGTTSSPTSQKKFKKSNDARWDMSVLAMTYILQDNPTIRELIRLIIGLNDHDDSGKVCTTCNPW